MSAARLDLDGPVLNAVVEYAMTLTRDPMSHLSRRIGPARTPRRCPECHSIIYSRRHQLCGVCSNPLPHDLLFTPTEANQVEHLLRSEQARHRKWIKEHENAGGR